MSLLMATIVMIRETKSWGYGSLYRPDGEVWADRCPFDSVDEVEMWTADKNYHYTYSQDSIHDVPDRKVDEDEICIVDRQELIQ